VRMCAAPATATGSWKAPRRHLSRGNSRRCCSLFRRAPRARRRPSERMLAAADNAPHARGELDDHLIAGGMAEAVVDELEVVCMQWP
jgi:hypothetical protein